MIKIRTKKKLGQHFLNNDDVANKIISYHSNRKNVLEIGVGAGTMMEALSKYGVNVIGLEPDKSAVKWIRDHLNLKVSHSPCT